MARGCWTCTNDSRATQVSAIYGLVVGVAWAIVSLLALLAVRCKLPTLEDSLMYLLYFFNAQCDGEAPEWLRVMQPGWPLQEGDTGDVEPRPAVVRTQALAASRFSLAAARAIASIALLLAEWRQRKERSEGRPLTSFFPVYFGWLIVVLLDCVLDAIIISIYSTDISHSQGAHNVMRMLGISVLNWKPEDLPAWVSDSPAAPAIIVGLVGSRGAPIFWIAEVLATVRVAGAARHIQQWSRKKPSDRLTQVPSSGGAAHSVAGAEAAMEAGEAGAKHSVFPTPVKRATEEQAATTAEAVKVEVATVEVHRWEEDPAPPMGAELTKRPGHGAKESIFE